MKYLSLCLYFYGNVIIVLTSKNPGNNITEENEGCEYDISEDDREGMFYYLNFIVCISLFQQ